MYQAKRSMRKVKSKNYLGQKTFPLTKHEWRLGRRLGRKAKGHSIF